MLPPQFCISFDVYKGFQDFPPDIGMRMIRHVAQNVVLPRVFEPFPGFPPGIGSILGNQPFSSMFIRGFEVGRLCLISRSLRHCARNVVLLRVFKLLTLPGTNLRGGGNPGMYNFPNGFKCFGLCPILCLLRQSAKTLFY